MREALDIVERMRSVLLNRVLDATNEHIKGAHSLREKYFPLATQDEPLDIMLTDSLDPDIILVDHHDPLRRRRSP